MEYSNLAIIAAFAFSYSIVASRLEQSRFNGALVYVLAGFLCSNEVMGWVDIQIGGESLKTLAELTLALVLFYGFGEYESGHTAANRGGSDSTLVDRASADDCFRLRDGVSLLPGTRLF